MSVIRMLLRDYRNEILDGSHLDEAAALLAIESEFSRLEGIIEEIMRKIKSMKCHVKGCTNHSEDGYFVGEFCSPCYRMLGSGFVSSSEAWFAKEIKKAEEVGEIVLTFTEDGELVAVTRQDDDHKVIKVIWQKK